MKITDQKWFHWTFHDTGLPGRHSRNKKQQKEN